MNTFFITLPDEDVKQAALIGFLSALDEYLPGEIAITSLIKVETENERLAEMLRLGFEDSAQAVINPGIVMQYITFDGQAKAELETSPERSSGSQPAGLPYLLRDEPYVGAPTVLPAPANVDTAIAELEAEPDPATGLVDLRKACPECGAPFEGRKKYCSQKCYMKVYWRDHHKPPKNKTQTIIATPEPGMDVRQMSEKKTPSGQRKILLSTITGV